MWEKEREGYGANVKAPETGTTTVTQKLEKKSSKLFLVGLTKVAKLGPKTSRNLISYFGGAEEVFEAAPSSLLEVPGVGKATAQGLKCNQSLFAAEQELKFAAKHGIEVISYVDAEYPAILRSCVDAPLILYKRGSLNLNEHPGIAIVGTRQPSTQGRKWAQVFSEYFAKAGFNVVSGLAYGIDAESHNTAISAGGVTTAVLGHGLDQIYPKAHSGLARKILESGGGMLTEFASGTQPEAYNFPARNRIISGLAHATLVVEAREKGGAQITARFAFDQNREVYAIPGPLGATTSVGCNRLIRDQVAKLVMSPDEIIEDLSMILQRSKWRQKKAVNAAKKPGAGLTDVEARIVMALEGGAAAVEEISQASGVASEGLPRILLDMEFKGLVRQIAGKRYASSL